MNSSLRVLFVSSFGDFRGGGQHSLNLLIQGMVRAGVTPIVTAPEEGDFLASLREGGIETHVIPVPRIRGWNFYAVVRTIRSIRRFLKDTAIQLVHTDGPRSTLLFGRAARSISIPLAFHVRVSTPEPRWFERLLAAHADALICVSSGAADRFSWHRPSSLHVIPNGVDLDLFRPCSEPSRVVSGLRDSEEEVLIGEVAFIMPAKGQDVLVSAAAALNAKVRSRLKLLFIGAADPDYLQMLQRKVKQLELTGRVAFLGAVDDIRSVLAGLDAVALPSVSEGLPRSLIEAAAMQLPLIANDIPGCRDVVMDEQNGYLCSLGDVASWSRALERMIIEADRTDMGAKGRALIEKRFDARMVTRRIMAVYEEVLARVEE